MVCEKFFLQEIKKLSRFKNIFLGPIVFPEDEETEVDETVVVKEVLKSSKLFVEESVRVEDIIAEQALELDSSVTTQIEQIGN